ncbi:glycoside hydrolase family 88/105 protein [Desertivirga xinjiangensis]|uniref:glycoside hydrolase family 88/105 protein n=1 Tax=Desertivirga xinjiangensis TaxID=539206 RepID=UPI00210D8D24|nr:glycoside hydrolase family 88 protein [Pedobacter xinjiangensis]
MKRISFFLFLIGCSHIAAAQVKIHSKKSIVKVMNKVADWQIDSIKNKGWRHATDDWTNAVLYTGLIAYADETSTKKVYSFLKKHVGDKLRYQFTTDSNRYHADYYCVGQLYASLYAKYKEPQMIAGLKELADTLLQRPHTESLLWVNKVGRREWAWCDALYMAPPALGMLAKATKNAAYLELCDTLWWKTTDYLYDKDEHLFYRDSRFFERREVNGQKVFWSRGNGWVIAGLARLMTIMPETYSSRAKYEQLFKDLAKRISTLQQEDGTWRTSLLDPASYPSKETSGTAFFCYAIAWGMNNGLLDKNTYLPVVNRAWSELVNCVHADGMLGFVQPIGNKAKAGIKATDTEVYGVGGFLLAGAELLKLK